jgi:hypothetical protein
MTSQNVREMTKLNTTHNPIQELHTTFVQPDPELIREVSL